jgi:zinc/manganese transport system substrate-binding protein
MSRAFALLSVVLLFLTGAAQAALNVVATTTSMGMLARTVGGDRVAVTELAPPDRDAHTLQVRPSMMQALRKADLVVAVGAELEQGWLPAAVDGSANRRILPGGSGYFEAAAAVSRIDVNPRADRSQGDVHPQGNPHIQLDPLRMAEAAQALALTLGKLDSAHATDFQTRAAAFRQAVEAQMPHWRKLAAGSPGVLLYHKDGNYLISRFGLPSLGYIEPLPGIPPGAAHLLKLVQQHRGKSGVILHTVYQGHGGIAQLAAQLGWKRTALPMDPPAGALQADYLRLMDQWLDAVTPGS